MAKGKPTSATPELPLPFEWREAARDQPALVLASWRERGQARCRVAIYDRVGTLYALAVLNAEQLGPRIPCPRWARRCGETEVGG